MDNITPLLSIIIPTKNRQYYCLRAVEQIVRMNLNDIEIVIQDNSDTDELAGSLRAHIQSENVKYHYHAGVLSFVDNFTEAVDISSGEYLCMIGDDDGILPNITTETQYAKRQGYDAIIPGLNAVYLWPSKKPIIKNSEGGYLCLSCLKAGRRIVNPYKAVNNFFSEGGWESYQTYDLPRLYHGIVSRTALERVRERTGKLFDGLTPDIYMAVALGLTCEKTARIGYPISISGICPSSGSADSATGKHTGQLKDAPHFRGHSHYQWDYMVPYVYSVETIWAETALHALQTFHAKEIYVRFNKSQIAGLLRCKYPCFKEEILRYIKANGLSQLTVLYWQMRRYLVPKIKGLFHLIFGNRSDVMRFYPVKDINKALQIICKVMKDKGMLNG